MFFNLFGSRKQKPPPRDVKALVQGLARPAVHIVSTERLTDSHLGGLPRVPAPFTAATSEVTRTQEQGMRPGRHTSGSYCFRWTLTMD
jgi:hypothetical protein